jgi:four helix bundle protein
MKTENRKERVSSFEDLEAWQMARRLVNAIYVLTRLSKVSRDFRLCSQVQAAAVSIMSNVAEGFERTHLQEKIQFYNVARGSAGEVRSLLYVVSDNFAEATAEAERLRDEVTTVGKLVTGLLNSTVRRRGIAARGIVALLSTISYLLTSISFHLR